MANWRNRRKDHKIYIISALLIIAATIAFIYRGHAFGPAKAVATSFDAGRQLENEIISPAIQTVQAATEPRLLKFSQPTAKDNPRSAKLISEAISYLEENPAKIIETRDRLSETLLLPMSEQQRALVKGKLSELADTWLFSRRIFPQDNLCSPYKVEPGDLLSTIGKNCKVPYEIIMEINNIRRPETLRAGETIKVINGPFHVRVHRSTFTMDLYLQNTFVRSFTVGLGKPGMETPTGLWIVKTGGKMISPTWTNPVSGKTYDPIDPDYPLGSRWIGLEGLKGDAVGRTGFAIHGTKDPKGVGIAGSQGCIRLQDENAILVYNLLVPEFSQVEVVE